MRFRGQADPPLNRVGREQAEATARYLADRWPVQAVYASPMERAMDTGKSIARAHRLSVRAFEGLLDIDFGEWQGHSPEEVKKRYPRLLQSWFDEPQTVRIPGGESLAIVRERVTAGLGTIRRRHRGQSVAMIGHMVVNRVLLCAVLGLSNAHFWRLRQDTCAVNVFDVDADGEATVELLNDTCHLRTIVVTSDAKREESPDA